MGLRPRQEISGSFPEYLSLMLGKPPIRLNNLKTSLRFTCLGLNPIIDSIILWTTKHLLAASSLWPTSISHLLGVFTHLYFPFCSLSIWLMSVSHLLAVSGPYWYVRYMYFGPLALTNQKPLLVVYVHIRYSPSKSNRTTPVVRLLVVSGPPSITDPLYSGGLSTVIYWTSPFVI